MDETDIQKLRDVGFSDAAITIAVQVISYFNYINRVADGLGVDLEPAMNSIPKEKWIAEKAVWGNRQ